LSMQPVPAADLRSNAGTWSVSDCFLPTVVKQMLAALPAEKFDPDFNGQYLQTTYFDTRSFNLLKARKQKDRYLTLRIRCYSPAKAHGGSWPLGVYALSAKTEDQKFRVEISDASADLYLSQGIPQSSLAAVLPADLFARALDLAGDAPLIPVVTVCFQRYAVEDDVHRLTLDCDIRTDTGKCFPANVLEQKSTDEDATPLIIAPMRPIKLSKVLWALQ